MNIADAKQQVKDTVEGYLAKDDAGMHRIDPVHQRPVFLIGAPGIGKTAIMAQIADELGVGLVSYSMTHHTRQSALGLPFIVKHEHDGRSFDVSEYTMSEIIASVYDYMETTGVKSGILFLDEVNCVSETLYPSMLQFLQFKMFGRHRVPEDWIVVCAGNPPEYNRSVHEFDIVTLDRLRKIEVEPDFEAWKSYARETSTHPAVMSYLDVRHQDFYAVEATPTGKSFVTARGWSDLSEILKLFEDLGKPIDQALIVQYLQNDEIAQRFALYYDLFNKYRSDYQVGEILEGRVSDEILARARAAKFDERLALLSLLLDGVETDMRAALEQEAVVTDARDVLREVKPALLAGSSVEDTLGGAVATKTAALEAASQAGVATREAQRKARLAINALKRLEAQCELAGVRSGAPAFEAIRAEYQAEVAKIEPLSSNARDHIDNAYAFIETAFGDDKELLVFTTELTARREASQFISRFGSDSYYAHNDALLVDRKRDDLMRAIAGLDEAPVAAPAPASGAFDAAAARAHYDALPPRDSFASMCRMVLPDNLQGRRVLDIGCRRGKGVYKLSSMVGPSGHVTGIDMSVEDIDDATAHIPSALVKSGLAASNMTFTVGCGEDLAAAGIAPASQDLIYINCLINVTYDPMRVLEQAAEALAPGGMLVLDTVVSTRERSQQVVAEARKIGNSVQSAPYERGLEMALAGLGLRNITIDHEFRVSPDQGCEADIRVAAVDTTEDAPFMKAQVRATK